MEKNKMVEIVVRAQKGDSEALNRLFNAYYNDVYYFAIKTVKDAELACDITQEAFVEVINTLPSLRDPGVFEPWLRGIAYHQCTRYFKKKKDVLVDEGEDGSSVFDTLQEERTEFIPEQNLDQQDFRNTVMAMIDSLSEEQRAAVLMYYFDELPVKTIAGIQGVSESAVKSRLAYARKAIKHSVEDYEKKNNVRLHSVAILPLLLWLYSGTVQPMSGSKAAAVAANVSRATGTRISADIAVQNTAAGKKAVTAAVKKSGMDTAIKWLLCAVGIVAVSVTAMIIIVSNNKSNAKKDSSEKPGTTAVTITDDETSTAPGATTPVITGESVWVRSGYVQYNADGAITYEETYTYEAQNNQLIMKTAVSDGREYKSTCTYDANGRVLDDGWNSYVYNGDVLASSTHIGKGTGRTTVKTYDAAGNLTEERDFLNYGEEEEALREIRIYDANGNMVKSEEFEYDGGYYRYEYAYDAAGNKISREAYQERGDYTDSSYTLYTYNGDDSLQSYTTYQENGLIITWTYQYDAHGNEILRTQKYSGKGSPIENVWDTHYQYDENGNMLECRKMGNGDLLITEIYTYHPNGTMKTKTGSWSSIQEIETWDEEGRLIENSRFSNGVLEYHYGYTYEEIFVPAEAMACVQAQQANMD